MKLAIPKGNGEFFTFDNADLKVGDKVFPLISGWTHKGDWYLTHIGPYSEGERAMLAVTGWHKVEKKRDPHTIRQFDHPVGEPCRVYTDKGYGSAQCYFKLIT